MSEIVEVVGEAEKHSSEMEGSESSRNSETSIDLFSDDPYEILNNYTEDDAPYKLILCVNNSLGMGKGKIAAQCSHATLGAYKLAVRYCPSAIRHWEYTGQAKVAVRVDKEEEMFELQSKAMAAGLVTCFIQDEGRTQIAAGSRTVLAIGPAPAHSFLGITSHLKLL